jgi:hypothetical protein
MSRNEAKETICLGEQTSFLPAPIPILKYSVSIHISLNKE